MRARKPSDPGSGRSSGRLGLTVLVAAVAAFLVVGVAQAAGATLKVKSAGTGSGTIKDIFHYVPTTPIIVCPSVCEGTFEEEFVPVAAIPAEGSEFTGWTINEGEGVYLCDGSAEEKEFAEGLNNEEIYGNSYVGATGACFIGEAGGEVTANFAAEVKETPNLEVVIESGEGTVVSNPAGISCEPTCSHEFKEGEKVTLTASPAPGYLFKSWKKCDTGGVNGRQCTVTIGPTLKIVGANFYKVFSLKGSKTGGSGIMGTSPGGIVCGYACSSSTALYKEGAVTVKAKPAKHFEFVEFKGGTGSASSCNSVKTLECTIATFNSNSTIEEVYAEEAKNTLSVTKEGGGQGFIKTTPSNINCGYTCTAAAAQFYASESAAITVTLNKGTTSVTWTTGAGTCTTGSKVLTCSVPMSAAHSLVAKFD